MQQMTTLLLTVDSDVVEELFTLLREHDPGVQRSRRKNLDGAAATSWILVAGVAVQSAPAILAQLRAFLTRNRVGVLEADGIKITNPGPEDVDKVLDVLRSPKG
jgi:hypothetical protein